MLSSSRAWSFRLETLHRRNTAALFLYFFLAIGLCIFLGLMGPEPYASRGSVTHTLPPKYFRIENTVTGLHVFNGDWWLYFRPVGWSKRSPPPPIETNVLITAWNSHDDAVCLTSCPSKIPAPPLTVTVLPRCPQDQPYGVCSTTVLASLHYIGHANMEFRIEFPSDTSTGESNRDSLSLYTGFQTEVVLSNYNFWVFEIVFHSFFLFLSVLALVLFIRSVAQLRSGWVTEHRAVLALLIALIFFNNPFFAATIFVQSWFFPTLDTVFLFSYLCVLLFLILAFCHNLVLKEGTQRKWWSFWFPKFAVLGAFWISNVVPYAYIKYRQGNTPSVSLQQILQEVALYTLPILGLYLLWVMYLVCRILGQWSSVTYLMKRWTHLFVLTLVVVAFTAFCVGFFLYGRYSAAEFLVTYGVYNFYTYAVAYLLSPSTAGYVATAEMGHNRLADVTEEGDIELQEGAWA
eukprot:RCo027058